MLKSSWRSWQQNAPTGEQTDIAPLDYPYSILTSLDELAVDFSGINQPWALFQRG